MINRSSAQGRRSTEEDSNTMTTPTFNTLQLDIPETAVADPVATPRQSQRGGIDTARFWVGAALTAGISALVALIALIITNDLLHIPVMISEGGGRLVMIGFGAYALFAAAAAVAASVLYAVLANFAPRPGLYFGWIVGLVTLLAALLPLTTGAVLVDQLALAGINLVVGLVITGLVPVAAVRSR
jgi:Family of unknown function (DUF6069)